ncbi:MAG: hypothetical protein WC759_01265 [Candidatus Micrarchaeia archaeon]|jgi:hypothetical protein
MYDLVYLVAASALFGYSMKMADLLDEHGLKWFKWADMLMGIAWGCFGAVLVLYDFTIANIMLAMIAGFVVRKRLDYQNHILAAALIVAAFALFAQFDYLIFLPFFLVFTLFGALKDYEDDVLHGRGWKYALNEAMLYYPIPTAVYAVLAGTWIPFIAFTTYTLAYDLTKIAYMRKGIA